MTPTLKADVLAALTVLPEETWDVHDDACDCTYPRIGFWTNPYLAETLEVRMCCIWARLYELFPGFVRVTPAFQDYNAGQWRTEPQEWDGESDMPRSVWYRQLARQQGRSLADIRRDYANQEPPKGTPRPPAPEVEPEPDLMATVLGIVMDMANRLDALEAK